MIFLFWFSLVAIVYVYVGYPLLLRSGLLGRARPIRSIPWWPNASIVVPAYNEEKEIASKIENLLGLDYPREKMELIIGNDGSTDRTGEIVRRYEDRGVLLVDAAERRGKSAVQNDLVAHASGDILVFTDADCLLPRDALRVMAADLADPEVALVTNNPSFINAKETNVVENEGLYLKYERWIRERESERGLLAMATGSLFALRREFWKPLDPNVGDDFALPLWVVQCGGRNFLEPRIAAMTRLTQTRMSSMIRMKIRVISKDLRGLLLNYTCLKPWSSGRVAIALWSHKLLRWFVPYFLLALLISNFYLDSRRPYSIVLGAQILFYGMALAGGMLAGSRRRFLISAISSFCAVNLAALLGTLHCMACRPGGQWRTVR